MANINIKPAKSIDDYGGHYAYLDATADIHNGLDARIFVLCLKCKVADAAIARLFNVKSVNTVHSWRNGLEQSSH